MKILHTADWHLDAPLQGHGESLRKALGEIPGRILELCRQEHCDLVLIAGATAVAAGAGMIYIPAGLIAGGVLAIAGAVLNELGSGGEEA